MQHVCFYAAGESVKCLMNQSGILSHSIQVNTVTLRMEMLHIHLKGAAVLYRHLYSKQ